MCSVEYNSLYDSCMQNFEVFLDIYTDGKKKDASEQTRYWSKLFWSCSNYIPIIVYAPDKRVQKHQFHSLLQYFSDEKSKWNQKDAWKYADGAFILRIFFSSYRLKIGFNYNNSNLNEKYVGDAMPPVLKMSAHQQFYLPFRSIMCAWLLSSSTADTSTKLNETDTTNAKRDEFSGWVCMWTRAFADCCVSAFQTHKKRVCCAVKGIMCKAFNHL